MRVVPVNPVRPLFIRPGALVGECSGERERRLKGTGVTALYTHLRVSPDCYTLVTPLDTLNSFVLCIKAGELLHV